VRKKWPNDFRIGCKSLSSLVELIEMGVELNFFESTFEYDEVMINKLLVLHLHQKKIIFLI
jgi:hypothetical protein